MKNNKGLSDVVTTVLIILLVVSAVVAVGAFILPMIKNTGKTVEKGVTCITNTVSPIACRMNSTGAIVSYTRTTDDSVKSVNSVTATLSKLDGSVVSANANNVSQLANGASASLSANGVNFTKVSLVSEFTLDDGQKQSCTSAEINCN